MQVHEFDPHCLMKEAAKVDKSSRCLDFLVVLQSKTSVLPTTTGPAKQIDAKSHVHTHTQNLLRRTHPLVPSNTFFDQKN